MSLKDLLQEYRTINLDSVSWEVFLYSFLLPSFMVSKLSNDSDRHFLTFLRVRS